MNDKETLHEQRCTILNASLVWKLCLKPVSLPLNRKTGKVEMSNSCGRETLTFLTLPVISVQTAAQSLTTMQSSGFPTHVDHRA